MARTFEEMIADASRKAEERDRKAAEAEAAAAPKPEPKASPFPAYTMPTAQELAPIRTSAPAAAPKPAKPKNTNAAPPVPGLTPPAVDRQPVAEVSAPKAPKAPKVQPALAPPAPPKAEIVLPPDITRDVDYKRFYDNAGDMLSVAKKLSAQDLGMSVDELEKVAAAQGVDLESINDQKIKGRTFDEVAAAARQRGTLGFLPVPEREAIFRKTVEDVELAQRGETRPDTPMVQSIEDEGMLQGYFAPGLKREFDSVSQPGEYGYLTASLLVEALKKDPEASRIWDLYGRGLATGNTQKYVEERAQDLMKRAGVGPNDPQSFDKYKAFRKRATNEVLAYKTIGQWTPAIVAQDVEVSEGVERPGFFAAIGPNVELVGVNNRNQAVFRQESPLSVGFRFIDIPQGLTVGALMGEGAATGVQTGANFMELSLEKTKDSSAPVKIISGLAGFVGSVLYPDLFIAAGLLGKGARLAKVKIVTRANQTKAMRLLETASEARRTGDYAAATKAESELRKAFPGSADNLDEMDAYTAKIQSIVDPDTDILSDDLAEVFAAHVPAEKRLAGERIFMHPSARKPDLSGNLPNRSVPMTDYPELYRTDELLKREAEARAAYLARTPDTIEGYASMYSKGATRDVLRPAIESGTLTAQQVDEISDIVAGLAPKALSSMDDFADELRTALKAHPEFSKPEYNVVRQSLYVPGTSRLRARLDKRLAAIRGKTPAELQAPTIALFDRMKKGILDSNEARAKAAALLRDEIAEEAKVRVQPLKALDDVAIKAPDGSPLRLSSGGVLFLGQLRAALPKADFKEAYSIAQLVDTAVRNAAKADKIDSLRVYSELLPEIRRATASEIDAWAKKIGGGAPPTTPIAPAAAAAAAPPPAAPAAAVRPVRPPKPVAPASAVAAPAAVAGLPKWAKSLPESVQKALAYSPALPAGNWMTADIASVKDARALLEQAAKNRIPGAARFFMEAGASNTGTFAIVYGDARIIATENAGKYDVIVVVGDANPARIKGASDIQAGMLRGLDAAEQRMAARVKQGEPAIKGAAVIPQKPVGIPLPPPPAPAAAAQQLPPPPAATKLPPPPPQPTATLPPPPPPSVLPPPPPPQLPPVPAAATKLPPPPPPSVLPPVPLPPPPPPAAVVAAEAATRSAEQMAEALRQAKAATAAAEEVPAVARAAEEVAEAASETVPPVAAVSEATEAAARRRAAFEQAYLSRWTLSPEEAVRRLGEVPEELLELRRASDSGDPAAFKAYETAAREEMQRTSGGVWNLYNQATRGEAGAVEAIEKLAAKLEGLEASIDTQRARALRAAAESGDEAAAQTLKASRLFDEGEVDELNAIREAWMARPARERRAITSGLFESAEEYDAIKAAREAAQAERRAARTAPEVFERAAEEAPAVAKAEEAVSAAPATPVANVEEAAGQVLKQVSAAGDVKGMVLNEKGKNVIVLFQNADASTVLHEVAHVLRRGVLKQADMDAITKWINSKGVKVTHANGEFVGSAADVERAEELFAKGFEEYVRLGQTPVPRLANVFQTLKVAVAHAYRNVADPVVGQNLDPEVSRVFDELLADVPDDAVPSIKEIVKREMFGGPQSEDRNVLSYLSREAERKGLPKSSLDEITENFELANGKAIAQEKIARFVREGKTPTEAADAARQELVREGKLKAVAPGAKRPKQDIGIEAALANPGAAPDPIYLSFPVPVRGKKDWTLDDLAATQRQLEFGDTVAEARKRGILLDLSGRRGRLAGGTVIEETPLEKLRASIAEDEAADGRGLKAKTKAALRAVAFTFFGGDVVGNIKTGTRGLPPALRKATETASRVIDQSLNDIVGLTNDALEAGNASELYRYLGGSAGIRRIDGRNVVSAGHDYMGSVQQMIRRMIEAMPDEQKAAFALACDAMNQPAAMRGRALATVGFDEASDTFKAADAARQQVSNNVVRAVNRLINATDTAKDTEFGAAFSTSLRRAIEGGAPPTPRPGHEFRMAESMSYVSGFTARNGQMFKGTSEEAARIFINDVAKIYQSEETGRRVAIIVGGYGAASLGKDVMVKMNLGISADAHKAFGKWLAGEQWDPKYTATIQRIVDEYGFNPQFVSDEILDATVYFPRAARDKMAQSLGRTTFKSDGTVGVGDGVNLVYRYMKIRMTRGNWFLKQRYYMMNTVDHFNQMGMQNGFGVAAASVTRVLAQDIMVLPMWQQVVAAAVRTKPGQKIINVLFPGLSGPRILEQFRSGLQRVGDRASFAIGRMFNVSKYRIEVNPILEGLEGGFTAGGKVYSYRQVRDIAVQEGIFSSFDASQLTTAIQRDGALFFDAAGAATTSSGGGRLKNLAADWQQTVASTAEAWSERERLGGMITLMEAGYDPRTAARLTVDALYDYARSMTDTDRSMLMGIMFPFWAFQKNANTQIFNLMFSPYGAYRMMVLRRARERSADAITAILHNMVGDEYDMDVESMPEELQQSYYALITKFEESYPDGPPPEAKRAMRMLLSGRAVGVDDGKYIQTSGALQELHGKGTIADLQRFTPYYTPKPSKTSRPSRLRERAGIAIPFPRTEQTRLYYSLLGDQHTYMELFYPESTIEAGMKHITQVASAYLLMGATTADALLGGPLKEGGIEEVKLLRVIQPIADPMRSPLLVPLLAGTMPDTAPVRLATPLSAAAGGVLTIHPFVGKLMDDAYGTTFLRTPAKEDPFAVDPDKGEMFGMPKEAADRIRALQKEYPDAGKIRDQRYRIPGGVWSVAFENSPLGELNALMLRWEEKPLERNALQGEILRWARAAGGFDVEEISPQATIRFEEPKKLDTTKGI